jgi:signal transduction histidine kinase
MTSNLESGLVNRLRDIIARSPDAAGVCSAFTVELESSGRAEWARAFLVGDEEGGAVLPVKNVPRHDVFVLAKTVVEAEPSLVTCQQLGCPGRARSIVWLPLVTGADVAGVLVVASLTAAADPVAQLPGLQYLAGMLSLAIQVKRLQQETEVTKQQDSEWVNFVELLVHELKTSLTTIISSAGLLKERTVKGADELQLRLIQNLGGSVNHLESTISELPSLARARRRRLRAPADYCTVGPVLREALANVRPVAQERHQIVTLDCPESLPKVAIGQNQLKQVLRHLLSSAVESTPERGEITLRAAASGGYVVIEVGDGGPIIPREKYRELFEPAHWVEVDSQLIPRLRFRVVVSKLLVEACGGELWLDSGYANGNTFVFRLPIDKGSLTSEAMGLVNGRC